MQDEKIMSISEDDEFTRVLPEIINAIAEAKPALLEHLQAGPVQLCQRVLSEIVEALGGDESIVHRWAIQYAGYADDPEEWYQAFQALWSESEHNQTNSIA